MNNWIFEGKYELDSLIAVLKLSFQYYDFIKDITPFNNNWVTAIQLIINTIQLQQNGTHDELNPDYSFQRLTYVPTDTLLHSVGSPAKKCGMSKSPFRPSDDATTLNFPVNFYLKNNFFIYFYIFFFKDLF